MRVAMSSSSPLSLPFSSSTIAQTPHRKYSASVLPTPAVPPQLAQQQPCTTSDDANHINQNSPPKPKTIRFRLSQLCREGQLHLARQVFDAIPQPTTVLWNTLIIGYVCNNMPHDAISMYSRMFRTINSADDRESDAYTYSSVLKACAETKQLLIGKAVHCHILRSNVYPSRIVYNSLLNMYATCLSSSDCDLVKRVFGTMRKRNVVSWNTMISCFVNVFPAISGLEDIEIANMVYGMVIKLGVVALYSRCNSIGNSFKVFSGMQERDVVSWNTIICAFVQNGLDDEGLMLVYEMQKLGFAIDGVTITALLSAASNLRNHKIGKETHAYLIRHGIQFNGMESYLIDMYAKSGLIQDAERIFNGNCKGNNDLAVWNAMISGSTQNELVEQSLIIFQQMLMENIMPNAVTLASILPACSQLGSIALGKLLHERVFLKSAEKNSVTYTNMILGHGQHGMGKKAIRLFHSMRELGINPDAITVVAVLSACSYSGLINEGLEIFECMESEYGIKPSTEHYACIVDMLGRVGRVVEAYDFAQKLGKEEEGNWEHVKNVREEMLERGLMKEVGCSWIDISGYANCFVSRDKKHPLCAEIYQLLNHLSANLKDTGYTPPFLSNEC
ncbi:UNVERIFIED_CONTAM: Pentatricopeptide repeat-containing protein, chloroplastic [Sesamum calycinum]|uniref:Pentatricopeptide repeat-containing protein, chloroplastic n=1 Tax=Sesamum calycinum TaxID=2727403 RepID=A0AAW2RS14_9LAMI